MVTPNNIITHRSGFATTCDGKALWANSDKCGHKSLSFNINTSTKYHIQEAYPVIKVWFEICHGSDNIHEAIVIPVKPIEVDQRDLIIDFSL